MLSRQLIETNLTFLRRTTFQGTELEALVALVNGLTAELQLVIAAEQQAVSPIGKPNGASHESVDAAPAE